MPLNLEAAAIALAKEAANGVVLDGEFTPSPDKKTTPKVPPRIGATLRKSLARARARAEGKEKPLGLYLPILADHFGGGFWAGFHVVNSGTGKGKTQFVLAQCIYTAKQGDAALYLGFESDETETDLRLLGLEAGVPWAHLWTGKATAENLDRAEQVVDPLSELPFHSEPRRPKGFSPSDIRASVEGMRQQYPDKPGDPPLLVIVDYLQIVGDEPDEDRELRMRIRKTAEVLKEIASRHNVAIVCISSISREAYKLLASIQKEAGLTYTLDPDGHPISRRILNMDAVVGIGKECGEIEYFADSVSLLAPINATRSDLGCDVVFLTAKGRATGERWSPLRFTNFAYKECADGGAAIVEAWKAAEEGRARASAEKKQAKESKQEQDKIQKMDADAKRVATYLLANPRCTVRKARVHTVANSSARWRAAVERLGEAISQTGGCTINLAKLKPEHDPRVQPTPKNKTDNTLNDLENLG